MNIYLLIFFFETLLMNDSRAETRHEEETPEDLIRTYMDQFESLDDDSRAIIELVLMQGKEMPDEASLMGHIGACFRSCEPSPSEKEAGDDDTQHGDARQNNCHRERAEDLKWKNEVLHALYNIAVLDGLRQMKNPGGELRFPVPCCVGPAPDVRKEYEELADRIDHDLSVRKKYEELADRSDHDLSEEIASFVWSAMPSRTTRGTGLNDDDKAVVFQLGKFNFKIML